MTFEVAGYSGLDLVVGTNGKQTKHTLFLKKHESRSDDDYAAVFAANLPRDLTFDNVKDIVNASTHTMPRKFVRLGDTYGLFCCAYEAARDKLLAWASKRGQKKPLAFEIYGPRGSDAYKIRNSAKYPDEAALQASVDEYMRQFDEAEEEQRLEMAKQGQMVDEDGFTLVVNPKRKSLADIPAPVKKKSRSLEKDDFYRFQLRERRKNEMNALLKRYQDDKAKVEELKQKKKLRPY